LIKRQKTYININHNDNQKNKQIYSSNIIIQLRNYSRINHTNNINVWKSNRENLMVQGRIKDRTMKISIYGLKK